MVALRTEESQQNESAEVKGHALLHAEAKESEQEAEDRKSFAKRIGDKVTGLPMVQADGVIRTGTQALCGGQYPCAPHDKDHAYYAHRHSRQNIAERGVEVATVTTDDFAHNAIEQDAEQESVLDRTDRSGCLAHGRGRGLVCLILSDKWQSVDSGFSRENTLW